MEYKIKIVLETVDIEFGNRLLGLKLDRTKHIKFKTMMLEEFFQQLSTTGIIVANAPNGFKLTEVGEQILKQVKDIYKDDR